MLLPAGNPSAWTGPTGNNTYLLDGRVPTLVDAGVGHPDHLAAIERALAGRSLATVLITHGHSDHVSGVPALIARWPRAVVRQFGAGERPILDGERIDAGDRSVTVLHTPGHSPDHCCFVEGEDVFCGDLARIGGTVVIPATRGGDLARYLASLQRVRALDAARLLPGHGPIVDDPAALIDAYVRHRLERERQILAVLASGAWTPDAIVAAVYEGLPEGLIAAAAETVRAHLIKLRDEGQVIEDGDRWTRAS